MLGLTITQWLFGTLSLMAIMFALMMVFTRSPVNSALYLIMTFSHIYQVMKTQMEKNQVMTKRIVKKRMANNRAMKNRMMIV